MASKILMYLSYGQGPHVPEVVFSAMSALHTKRPGDDFDIVILTDDPAPYADLPVKIELITPQQMTDWAGPGGFGHRRKIVAFKTVLEKFGVPVVLVDGDTYFRKSPAFLYDRIGAGRSIMHVHEGELGYLAAHGYMKERLSGLSVDTANFRKIRTARRDGRLQRRRHRHGTRRREAGRHRAGTDRRDSRRFTQLAQRAGGVQHDPPDPDAAVGRAGHRVSLPRKGDAGPAAGGAYGLLKQAATMPAAEKYAFMYGHRPKPPLVKKIKAALKRPLKKLGLFRHDLQTSI